MGLRRASVRIVVATVLVTLALVPTLARAHDRIDQQRTPAQEHSRFRWTNSCESVPQKVTVTVAVAAIDGPTAAVVVPLMPQRRHVDAIAAALPPPPAVPSPHPLRAPPQL